MLRNKENNGNEIKYGILPEAVHGAPALACAVLAAMAGAFIASKVGAFSGFETEMTLALVQLAAFVIPGAVYFLLYGKRRLYANFIRRPEKVCGKFTIISGFLLVVTVILTKAISAYVSTPKVTGSVYSPDANLLTVIAVSVILPPLLEEITVRGFILSAYEKKCGGAVAITASAIIFAFLHFSLNDFFTYFVAGLILGTLVYVTRSVFGAIIIHLVNNIISLYFDSTVFRIVSESNSGLVAIFVLALFALFLVFMLLSELENICKGRFFALAKTDKQNECARLTAEDTSLWKSIKFVVASPFFILAAILFFVFAAII